jgi:hypothetical protein
MQINNSDHQLVIKNERIWSFYNSHTVIDIETANLLLIDFFETIFNKVTTNETNINSQILRFMQEHSSEMSSIKHSLASIQDNMNIENRAFTEALDKYKKETIDIIIK